MMKTKKLLSILLTLCMIVGLLPAGTIPVFADDSSYSATFKYNGKTYSENKITGSKEIQLTTILTLLEITGTVTAASVSEGQGMTVTTTAITLTKAFGTGWLKVTTGETEHQITITSTPDSISVVLYGTLFFDKNGGSGIMDGQSVREYSTTVLPDCAFTPPDGYEFDQWEINGARYNAGATYTFGQTTTAKAIWKLREGVHSITATYNNSDGDVVVSPTMAAAGDQVTVTVQPVAGKAVDSISYSYGSTAGQALSGGEGGVYTFSMPGEATTVSVTFKDAAKEPIDYVNENGSSQSCDDYRYVRSTDTTWSGWVVASQNLTLDRRVTVSGTVNLILMDGKTLTVTGGIQVGEDSTLNIYAQSGNTGKLIAGNKQNSYAAGIGGNKGSYNAGTIIITGGQITATGGYSSAGIGGSSEHYPDLGNAGTIKICGNANVDATGGEYGSGIGCGSGGIGGSITIDGNATVQAKALEGYSGSGAAIGSGGGGYVNSITISGGTVIATGANMGSAIGNGNSNSGGDGGTISITGGDVTATATGSWGAGIGGLCKSITIGGNAIVHATGGNLGAGIGGYYQKAVGNITVEGNANVTATGGASGAGIGTGSEAEGEAVITITGGTVNASMSASNGAAAIGSGYKSKGKTTVFISGGQVTAAGSSIYGVGIGGGNTGAAEEEVVVNITGGTVNASGRAGIGTANASNAKQTINISGGMVTARGAIDGSNKCAAIGQGNNSNSVTEINITGGIVRALGTGTGIGSGANSKQTPTIMLGYTDETKNGMEITAIDYNGTVTLNNNFKYQDGTGAVSTPITANKTIVPSDSTAHTHGFNYTVDGKTITATCTNSDNQCNLTEHKATLTIGEPDGKTSMVYDGTAKAAVLTGDTNVLTADVVYKKGNTVLPSAPSDAGSYTASITLGEATATASYAITKKPVTFASITAQDKVYDGTTKASCKIGTRVNGAVSGDNVYAYVYTGNATFEDANVGVNKTVTFSNWRIEGTDKGNYELIQPEPQYRAITPRIITVTAKDQTVAVGGTVVSTPDQVEITSGTLVSGHSISEVTLTGDTSAITDSGTVTSSAIKILDSSNVDVTANYLVNYVAGKLTVTEAPAHTHSFIYTGSGVTITADCSAANCPLTDHKATLTINAPTSLTYDSTTKAATVTGEIPGVTTQEITYTKDGDASFTGTPINAGSYTASITLEGATASVSYTIEPKPVTITGLSASEKVYDGTTAATVTGTGTIEGKVGSDNVSVDTSAGTATFDSANVGTDKTVTFSGYALSGESAGNYTLSAQPASVTANITAKPITIKAKDQSVELNNEIATGADKVEVSSGALVSGQNISEVTVSTSNARTATGEFSNAITVSAAIIKDASGNNVTGNYAITYAPGKLTVTKVKAKVTTAPTANNRTYDGTAADLLTGGMADTPLEYSTDDTSYSPAVPQGTNANTYTVYYRAAADGNYEVGDAAQISVTIGKAPLTVTAKPKTITYGDAPANDGVTYTGFVNSETESVLGGTLGYDYNYEQFGDVGGYTITPKGLTAGNYAISFVAGTLTVDQKELGLEWSNTSLTYSGSAQAPIATATGTVNSDEITVTVSGAQTDAGTGYTATASGLTGDKAGNYKLPTTGLTQAFSIGKAAAPTLSNVALNKAAGTTSITASVAGKMPANAGTLNYAKGTESVTGGHGSYVSSWSVDASGTVSASVYTVAEDTITLPVTISSTNYEDSTVSVVVTLVDKSDACVTISGDSTKTYGDAAFKLTASAENPGGNGVWTWESSNTSVATVTSEGVVTIVGGGTTSITATYDSDTTIGHASLTLTVNPKAVAVPTAASGLKWTGSAQTGVADGEGYTVMNGAATAVGSYTATATLTSTVNYQWNDGSTAPKDIPWSIGKADGPAAPTGLAGVAPTTDGGSDGKITGVTTKMEYSADGSFYTPCSGTEITGLSAGTYYVRYKETATHEAGAAATVSVPAYGAPTTYSVTVTNGTGGGSYASGETVTITANAAPSGKRFKAWTGVDGLTFTSGSATTATAAFTMPARAVTLTATYEDVPAVPVTGVTLNRTTLYLTRGNSATLTATVAPSNATNKAVTWSSGSPGVATVDANGKVTAVAVGTAIITVTTTDGGKTAQCTVTVSNPTPSPTPSGGGDGDDYTPSTPSNTTTTTTKDDTSNPDATTTDDTKTTATTTNSDGSTVAKTTETATKNGEDGSKTEIKGESTTTTKTNTDGTTTAATTATQTATTTAADGSKTTTETKTEAKETLDKSGNGTVESKTTETVKDESGKVTETTITESKGTIETAADGTKTTTTTNTATTTDAAGDKSTTVTTEQTVEKPDGSTSKVVSDESGNVVSVEAKISENAVENAEKSGDAVTIPVTVTAAQSAAEATTVEITVPKDAESIKVEIPVEGVKPGTVAVIVHEDGTEEIVKTSTTSDEGVVLTLDAGATVKIVDNTKPMKDVKGDEWYADNIAWATSHEVMNGMGDGDFSPDAEASRAQIAQLLFNLDGAEAPSDLVEFLDVHADDWFAESVTWAVENDVAHGKGDSFGANDPVSREQLAVMLYNYARYKGYDTTVSGSIAGFPDAGDANGYARSALAWAVGVGLINGTTDENGNIVLNPQGSATRAQVAAIIERFCENVVR